MSCSLLLICEDGRELLAGQAGLLGEAGRSPVLADCKVFLSLLSPSCYTSDPLNTAFHITSNNSHFMILVICELKTSTNGHLPSCELDQSKLTASADLQMGHTCGVGPASVFFQLR